MIAVIPIFIEHWDRLWLTPKGLNLIHQTLQSVVNAQEIHKVFVLTNNNTILTLSKSLTTDTYFLDLDSKYHNSSLLPIGTQQSLEYLQASVKLEFDDLFILSFRNPLLTSDLIDEAKNEFRTSIYDTFISVKKITDHPCQLTANYKILDIGFIYLFDTEINIVPYLAPFKKNILSRGKFHLHNNDNSINRSLKLSKPFFFDWESRGIQGKGSSGIYIRKCDNFSIKYIPVEENNNCLQESSNAFWIYDCPDQARILFNKNNHNHFLKKPDIFNKNDQPVGQAFTNDSNEIPILAYKDSNTNEYSLAINSDYFPFNNYFLRLFPAGDHCRVENSIFEFKINNLTKPITFRHDSKDLYGIIYVLLKIAQDSPYEFSEYFPSNENLWSIDPSSGVKINRITGKEIMGRQDFPDVFEPEGSFIILKKDMLSSLTEETLKGNIGGFVIQEHMSIQIKSDFDLLRYKAFNRAKDN